MFVFKQLKQATLFKSTIIFWLSQMWLHCIFMPENYRKMNFVEPGIRLVIAILFLIVINLTDAIAKNFH